MEKKNSYVYRPFKEEIQLGSEIKQNTFMNSQEAVLREVFIHRLPGA